jgi:hypothetical protein
VSTGLSFAVNTNWDLFQADADKNYYLRDDKTWLTSKDPAAGWQIATALPDALTKLPDDDNWKAARTAIPLTTVDGYKLPKVVYSETPAELIQFEGEAEVGTRQGNRPEMGVELCQRRVSR